MQLAANETGPIHMLITDVIMPDMNGRRLSDTLQALRPDVRTPYVSGYRSNVIAHHGVLDEGVEFLEKPYSRRQLLARVRGTLDQPAARTSGPTAAWQDPVSRAVGQNIDDRRE